MQTSAYFENACRRFDEENGKDPNSINIHGTSHPRELYHAERLNAWVQRLCPTASEELLLAARCQHICRWMIARNTYPMTREGYLKWRSDLKQFHAKKSGEILREVGYPEEVILSVQNLNLKKNFPSNPESRVLEDALCLTFLEDQLGEFAGRTDQEKVIGILQKTWKKMTPTAQKLALELPMGATEKSLVQKALA